MPGGGGCSGRKTSGEWRKADSSSRAVENQASWTSGAGATAGGRVERLADGVHQLAARRRFEQIPDRPQTLPDLPILRAVARRQDDDRRLLRGAVQLLQAAHQVETSQVRHHHVEQEQIERLLERQAQALLAAAGGLDLVACRPQGQLEQSDRVGLVVDDQDLWRVCHDGEIVYRPERTAKAAAG